MDITHTFARMGMNRRAAAYLLIIMAPTLAALISACSDSSLYVAPASVNTPYNSPGAPRTPTVRDESVAAAISDSPEKEGTVAQSRSDDTAVSNRVNVSVTADTNTNAPALPEREDESDDTELEYEIYVLRRPETGPLSLDERILRADIIARATLTSVSTTTPLLSDSISGTSTAQYVSALELRFDAHEYLKGSGSGTLVVELPLSLHDFYPSAAEAVAAARDWLPTRDTLWDDREAVIFLQNPIGSPAESPGSGSNRYVFSIHTLGYDRAHDLGTAYAINEYYIDTYSIRSEKNKVWLPATAASDTSSAVRSVETSYYLEEPPSPGAGASSRSAGVSSITLPDLKTRVQAMVELLEQGAGVNGYRRCVEQKYAEERALQTLGLEGIWTEAILALSSGLPGGSEFNRAGMFGGAPGTKYSRFLFAGPDTHLFEIDVEDSDTDAQNGYIVVARAKRPLPKGTYDIHYHSQNWLFIPCDYIPNSYTRWNVHVTAPAGTLHEAFFDPALDTSTSAVGAGGANGVLKPASFTIEGAGTITIERIEWKSASVRMELAPHRQLTGYHMDFIAMDGSVGLSLDFDDATATTTEDGSNALSWSVTDSPWANGDLLMLRISRPPPP